MSFDNLVEQGIIEFIDVNESGNSLFAVYEKDIKKNTTHLEVGFCLLLCNLLFTRYNFSDRTIHHSRCLCKYYPLHES